MRQYGGGAGPTDPAAVTGWVLERQAAAPAGLATVDERVRRPVGRRRGTPSSRAPGRRGAGLRLVGPPDRDAVLTRLDLAERVRHRDRAKFVEVDAPAELRDDLAAGLVSGRVDRVACTGERPVNPRLVAYPPDARPASTGRQGLWGNRTIADEFHAVARRPPGPARGGRAGRAAAPTASSTSAPTCSPPGLAARGLGPGDPVLFQVTNRLGSVVAWYGALKAGLVPVCTLAAHRGHEIGEISRRVGAVAHLVEADLVGFAREQQRDHPTLRAVLVLDELAGLGAEPRPAALRARPSRGSRPGSTPTAWPSSSSPAARPGCPR